jgi:hypothetical protein
MTDDLSTAALGRAVATEALALALLIGEAAEIQWQPATTPKPREDTTERSRGGHGDPTLNTVADERRLAVRAGVRASEHLLGEALKALVRARKRMETVIDEHNGVV